MNHKDIDITVKGKRRKAIDTKRLAALLVRVAAQTHRNEGESRNGTREKNT